MISLASARVIGLVLLAFPLVLVISLHASWNFVCKITLLARRIRPNAAARPNARATMGYLVYNMELDVASVTVSFRVIQQYVVRVLLIGCISRAQNRALVRAIVRASAVVRVSPDC